MSIYSDACEVEQSLKEQFQEHLDSFYEREAQGKEDFLNYIYGPEEEEEES